MTMKRIEITANFLYDPDAGLMLTPNELADNVAMMLSECGSDEVGAYVVFEEDESELSL